MRSQQSARIRDRSDHHRCLYCDEVSAERPHRDPRLPGTKTVPFREVLTLPLSAAGGWRDASTLLRYQQPDEVTMRKVAEFERRRSHRPGVKR
jgi:hypothetical protein